MKISIITASYNYAEYIADVINSVINQTYPDWELIVVDDGSSDNSVEIIKSFCQKDERIKFLQHEGGANRGLKETLFLGLEHATGDWIAFLESDDFFKHDNLAKKAEVIKNNPKVKLVFNRVEFLWDKKRPNYNKKKFEATQKKLSGMKFPRNMFYDFFFQNVILTFSCVMVEKNVLKNANFNSPVEVFLDWWLWAHLAYENDFYYLDEGLTVWNLHFESYISKAKKPVLPQIYSYLDVYKNKGKEFKILLFLIYATPILLASKFKKLIFAR